MDVDGSGNLHQKFNGLRALDGKRGLLCYCQVGEDARNGGGSDVNTRGGDNLRSRAKRMSLVTSVGGGGGKGCAEVQDVQCEERRDLHDGTSARVRAALENGHAPIVA